MQGLFPVFFAFSIIFPKKRKKKEDSHLKKGN